MSEESECHKTPVRDHLLSLPKDLVFQYEKDGAWHNVPIGRIAHDAVELLDSLSAQSCDKLPQDVESWIASHTLQTGYQAAEPVVMVTPKEMRRFLASLQPKQSDHDPTVSAMATLTDLGYRHCGGIRWKPPIGQPKQEPGKVVVGTIGHVHPSKAGLAESLLRHKQSNEGLVQEMVNRFLGWKLPQTFSPDGYIGFNREQAEKPNCWPTGTNLFTATEAKAMFEYAIAALQGGMYNEQDECSLKG